MGPSSLPPAARSGPLFDRVADVETLRLAWDKVEANQGAAGSDGVTVARFALVAEAQIERLARLLRAGAYRPSPARRVYAPKKAGGVRPLDIPCVSDRVVQAAAAMVLDPLLDREMEPSSFAYRKGRSVAHAVARVAALRRQGYTHVVDGDIRSYFERIPHERLIGKLERHVEDAALVDLVWLWLETYSLTGRGVAQGSPISPLLANLYLDDVDERIEASGVRLVRFADDFLVLCRTPNAAAGALETVRGLLAGEGLELNVEKSRLVTFEQGFRFLGHVFVRSLVVQEVEGDDTPDEDAIAAAAQAARLLDRAAQEPFPEQDQPPGARARRLRPVYVVEPGRRLEAKGPQLRLVDDHARIVELPPTTIDRIEIGPGADATLAAMDLAAAHGVEVLRVDGHGEVRARYADTAPSRATRHLAQAAMILDPQRRAAMARAIVAARIHNQRALLRRLNRERRDPLIAEACARISRVIRKLTLPLDVAQAMGVEGEATALFWPAFGRALPPEFKLNTRRRRPAGDPANVALNVVSGLLARDIRSMALRAGLHAGFGALHTTSDAEEALVYDLIEEFRGPLAEACVSALFNRKALQPDHFAKTTAGLQLTREGWKAAIRGYEAWVARPIVSPASGETVLWRSLMLEQARAYAAACESVGEYRPYRMDY